MDTDLRSAYGYNGNIALYRPAGQPKRAGNMDSALYNLFYSFAFTIFNMSHNLMVPLSTRDSTQRGKLSVFNQIATIMMSGIVVALKYCVDGKVVKE